MSLPLPQFDAFGLALRPFRASDEVAWLGYLALDEVVKLTGWQVASPSELVTLMKPDKGFGPVRFALVKTTDDSLVGTIGFLDLENGQAEIAYDLAPHLWGKGIAGLACASICRWATDELGLQLIKASVLVGNRASARVLEKCGFKLQGAVRELRYANGKPGDYWVYRWSATV